MDAFRRNHTFNGGLFKFSIVVQFSNGFSMFQWFFDGFVLVPVDLLMGRGSLMVFAALFPSATLLIFKRSSPFTGRLKVRPTCFLNKYQQKQAIFHYFSVVSLPLFERC